VPSSADIYFVSTILGFLLLCVEFCIPGRVIPAMAGSVLSLGGAWRFFHLNHPFSAIHADIAAPLSLLFIAVIIGLLRIAAAGCASKRNLDTPLHFTP
jgi:membrane protein implicated in regulation of membrane protease activity